MTHNKSEELASNSSHHTAASFSPRIYGIVLLLLTIIVAGVWLISRFTAMDLARDHQAWQEKLNLVAESRADDVNKWVSNNFTELRSLSDNPSLQLYMSELDVMKGAVKQRAESKEPAQKSYLRNLLLFTAERSGYISNKSRPAIHANVDKGNESGLAVFNKQNEIVVSTAMNPATRDLMVERIKDYNSTAEEIIDLQHKKDGLIHIGFTVPIFAIQRNRNADSYIGRVIGIKTVEAELFNLLKHPGVTEKTLETILLRRSDKKLEYLSPLLDGSSAMSKQVKFDSKQLAEAELSETTGGFLSKKFDYRKKIVLATSRSILNTPWTLVVKVDSKEALAESNQRRSGLIIFFFFIVAIIVLIIFSVWWHAHSKRAMMMSHHFKKLAEQAEAQENLLRLVTNHQPEPIYILDMHKHFHFANQKAAEAVNMSSLDISGKTINDVRGNACGEGIFSHCMDANKNNQITYDVSKNINDNNEEKIIRSAYIPLSHIPIASLPTPTPGVLVIEQDISEVVQEREHRINIHHQLIQTLVKLVDKRDPYAADHSMLVSHVACEIAVDMGLDTAMVETTRVAGNLLNIGKILVPTELLTKTKTLTDDERKTIHASMNSSAELIKDIQFDGPVATTLRQWQERVDGSGPLGIKGDDILVSARILAVSNAFIGMISPRSWRTAITIDAANKFLIDQSDNVFDRKVVVALINYVENHSGRTWLDKLLSNKKVA